MKQILPFIIALFAIGALQSQNEIEINFDAINQLNGNSVALDSVYVENTTLGVDTMIYAPFELILTDANIESINELHSKINDVKVYPNPFNQITDLEFSLNRPEFIFISVYNLSGIAVCTYNSKLPEGQHKLTFDAGAPGVYFISINGLTKKVISLTGNNSNISSVSHTVFGISKFKNSAFSDGNDLLAVYFPYIFGNMLHFVGYADGYAPFSIYDSPTSDMSFSFEMGVPYYRITKHDLTTEIPCFVNVMFSVTDTENKGIDYLTNNNFIVEEDNNPVSPTETFRYVRKLEEIDFSLKTALILDNSASVANDIEEIKAASISFVQQKIEQQAFAIYVFSSQPELIQDYTEDITILESAINSITTGFASTNLYGAVIEGVNSWDEVFNTDFVQRGFGIVFTDGDDTQGSYTLGEAITARGDKNLFMVGLGSEVNVSALNQLSSSGEYISINNVEELEDAFSEIQTDIIRFSNSFYLLNYMTPKRSGNHDIKVTITPNNNLGIDSFIEGTFNANGFDDVYSGVYLNISSNQLYGVTEININNGFEIDLKATTYWANSVPDYSWELDDTLFAKIEIDNYNAKAKIISNNHLGTTNLVLKDIANNYTNTIIVNNNFAAPIVDFFADITNTSISGDVNFTDISLNNPTSWFWEFGDGNTSNQQNPTHTYNSIGNYSVTLTAYNNDGSNALTKTNYITVLSTPIANFSADPSYSAISTPIDFIDNSMNSPLNWSWDFGDGNTSVLQNPSHSYSSIGSYSVSLTVSNNDGSDTMIKEDFISILPLPVAEFTASPTTVSIDESISFIDNSLNAETWLWEFGDGATSILQNPTHSYSDPGVYSIKLIVDNSVGIDSLQKNGYIQVIVYPVADFTVEQTIIEVGENVSFIDNSLYATSWSWDFGDGNTSTLQNPEHIYSSTGTYTIGLTASNDNGSDFLIKENYINVIEIPVIEWQKSLGGTHIDNAFSVQPTTDEGFVIAGLSGSDNYNVTNNQGLYDFWITKINGVGDIIWQNSFGGSDYERAHSIIQVSDDGYISVGNTSSNDGDITGNHGAQDIWLIRLNSSGDLIWQKTLGGSNMDGAESIQETSDGGFVIAGWSESDDGDLSTNQGGKDFWIVKIDNLGNIIWQNSLGGTNNETALDIIQTLDGGFIVSGYAESNDGDVLGNNGAGDFWIVRLNNDGDLLWQKCLGGSSSEAAQSIIQNGDGDYIIVGPSQSFDGDVTNNNGSQDYWVVKINDVGDIIWQKSYGGSMAEVAYSVQQTNNGDYFIVGSTASNNGDVLENHGSFDYWLIMISSSGELLWQKSLGGTDIDIPFQMKLDQNEELIIVGGSQSNDGNVTGNHGNTDFWIVKLGYE